MFRLTLLSREKLLVSLFLFAMQIRSTSAALYSKTRLASVKTVKRSGQLMIRPSKPSHSISPLLSRALGPVERNGSVYEQPVLGCGSCGQIACKHRYR